MKELGTPPGFKKSEKNPNNPKDEIHIFLLSFVNDLNLQPFVMQIIVRFIIPIVHQFLTNITNTVMEKIANTTE